MIIVSNSLDDSSSGLVIQNFINDSQILKFDYIGIFEEVNEINIRSNIIQLNKIKLINRLSKVLIILFNFSPFCFWRSKLAFKRLLNKTNIDGKPFFIFVTGVNFFTIYFCRHLVRHNLNLNIHVHFLDTIVSRNSWGENRFLNNAKAKLLKTQLKSLLSIIKFSFTNLNAKQFVEELVNQSLSADILYSYPISSYEYIFKPKDEILIYYRGSLNYMRESDFILSILNEYAQINKKVKIVLQGNILTKLPKHSISNINLLEFSRSSKLLNEADVFLDVDLSISDIFIPGKLFEYFSYQKPIVCITPEGSSIRNLLKNDVKMNNLVSVCSFRKDYIFEVLNNLVARYDSYSTGKIEFTDVKTLKSLLIG